MVGSPATQQEITLGSLVEDWLSQEREANGNFRRSVAGYDVVL